MTGDALLAALRDMLPRGAGAAWADPGADHPLLPGEDLLRATPARLREFSAGRHAARAALRAAGLPVTPLAQGADRAPVWPEGTLGSITHTATDCLAVALPAGPLHGIGIDLEPAVPLARDLWQTILRAEERAAVLQSANPGLAATQIFSAKEAVFKAFYPLTRSMVGFDVASVTLTATGFAARLQTDLPPLRQAEIIHGRMAIAGGHILTLAMI